jgi:NAD(P)-dependent dehydrogenase (short-subunit alcohol dehydrogenase family)
MKKTVIITGAGGNLGKATVRKLSMEGYKVIATLSPGKKPEDENPEVETHSLDLTNEKDVTAFVNDIVKKYQRIDRAVLLVGGFAPGGIGETDGALLKKMFGLNFESTYFLSRLIFQQMVSQQSGGRIIFTGSRPALEPQKGKTCVAYSLSKSLLFTLAGIQNAEGQSRNVITSVIAPGTIDTPANRKEFDPQTNFNNWVKPEEVAETISFLCSENANALRDPIAKLYGNS